MFIEETFQQHLIQYSFLNMLQELLLLSLNSVKWSLLHAPFIVLLLHLLWWLSPSSWSGEWRDPLPLLSQPPSCSFIGSLVLSVLFFSSLRAMGIAPVHLLIHYFNKCTLNTFSMQQCCYKWTKSCAFWMYTVYKKCI